MIICGLDIGGTKVEAAFFEVVKESQDKSHWQEIQIAGEVLFLRNRGSRRIPTERSRGYQVVIENISELIKDLSKEVAISLDEIKGIGIGLPGSVDPKRKAMSNGNTRIFLDKNLENDLQILLKLAIPIEVSNDANCFALAEVLAGAGILHSKESGKPVKKQNGLGLILGTGLGGGCVINGQLIVGSSGSAFEIGHMAIELDGGLPCHCGVAGCAEQYLSGTAIEAAYSSRMYSQIHDRPDARKIFEMAEEQEPMAQAIIKQYKKRLAKYLANLTNILDPDYFVLGGGVSLQPVVYEGLEEEMRRYIYSPVAKPKVYCHQLGDSAGVLGAALLALI
ncbi:ROK family protein [Lentisphaera profundi]|uniref:ROK family protein n=1 Tax=Lentisphaera profundi TaxID=1658616 RepID=A0ABY7VUT1_9BACT|nr:ROK family protein [Lentisphaera profundi]WDE97504.1 ROK family protein [Lentisphaera profundi]